MAMLVIIFCIIIKNLLNLLLIFAYSRDIIEITNTNILNARFFLMTHVAYVCIYLKIVICIFIYFCHIFVHNVCTKSLLTSQIYIV